jgi:hypothetical protein
VVPRYSHIRHTGRLRPHHETSYALLVFLILSLGLLVLSVGWRAEAGTTGGGQYSVTAVVTGARPTGQAIITSPSNGQTFQANPVTVSGTCPDKTLVKIYKNGILAGSTICDPSRHFTIPIDLLLGSNALTALAYNTTDQPGPDSPAVNVTLTVPSNVFGFSNELLIQSSSYYRGAQPGDTITWPIELVGGIAPYAVSFDWGDGSQSDLVTRTAAGPFSLSHVYKKAGGYLGNYPLIIRATDSAGHTAYLQLTSIINKSSGNGSAGTKSVLPSLNQFVLIWPLWIILLLMVISFWLGERREKRVMRRQLEALA